MIGYCACGKCQTKLVSFLCTNKYYQTSLNNALLHLMRVYKGEIFVRILVNPCNTNNKTFTYIFCGRLCYKHFACINSFCSQTLQGMSPLSPLSPLSPSSSWRNWSPENLNISPKPAVHGRARIQLLSDPNSISHFKPYVLPLTA